MSLAYRYLIYSDHLRARSSGSPNLFTHVLLLELLDCMPVKSMFLGNIFDRRVPALTTNVVGKTFRIERMFRYPFKLFLDHSIAPAALHSTYINFEVYSSSATRQIPYVLGAFVVPPSKRPPASSANRFFERLVNWITRAFSSHAGTYTFELG